MESTLVKIASELEKAADFIEKHELQELDVKEKAAAEVRAEIISKSVESARKMLGSGIESSDQTRLQTEFVDKIQVQS